MNSEDQVRWSLSKDGEYSVKSFFTNSMNANIASPVVDKIWAQIWRLKLIPKIHLFIWKCLSNSLPTNSRIRSVISSMNGNCPHCLHIEETLQHLLLDCPYAKAVWLSSPYAIAHQNSNQLTVVEWIKEWFLPNNPWPAYFPNSSIVTVILSWYIWKSRCKKVFDDDCPNPSQTSHEAIIMIENQIRVLYDLSPQPHSRTNSNSPAFWRPPSSQFLKLNIDASFISSSDHAGIGILIRDNASKFKAAKCIQLRTGSSEQAEGLAILATVEWAKELKLSKGSFESDAQNLINFINHGIGHLKWRSKTILVDCKSLTPAFESVGFVYTPREANRPADLLARAARNSRTMTSLWMRMDV
ncbi:Reverse transcriptase zinc-binding domain [Macleaya cordata]|uniref:Reverse transcriptase zinc-binding domain n=1 Tax=Macleaya cordata TaxID=56857 RepID=A0A200QPP3_MACCD|nr:Reverse transcriptase zinc-binding domain [Macleaya cordata]